METENSTLEYGRGILQLGFASCPISWSAVKYLPSDICIRLFGWPNILFCTFADFYEITSFLTYRAANPINSTYFPYYDYDYLLVNKKKHLSEKLIHVKYFIFYMPFNVETLQAFGAHLQISHYYRKFLHCMLCNYVIVINWFFIKYKIFFLFLKIKDFLVLNKFSTAAKEESLQLVL
jgi:hypothetical protein